MEQKKVMWILFAVAALLLVVVGAGLIWFLPEDRVSETAVATGSGVPGEAAGFDPIEWVRSDEDVPGIKPGDSEEKPGEFVVSDELVYGAAVEVGPRAEETPVSPEDPDRAIRLVDPAPGSRVPPAQAEPRRQTPVAQALPSREPEKRLVTEYWIQTGSYGTNTRASAAREQLAEKGLTSTIQTRELESGTVFRVRIGPYGNNEEAAKFLEWVKNLDGFQDSYITEVYIRK